MPQVVEAQAPAGLDGVGAPQCVRCPQPEYSHDAFERKITGVVLLDVTVTVDGKVINPVVLKSVGYGLDEKAVKAVRKWKMKPAMGPAGKPVACRVQVSLNFELKRR